MTKLRLLLLIFFCTACGSIKTKSPEPSASLCDLDKIPSPSSPGVRAPSGKQKVETSPARTLLYNEHAAKVLKGKSTVGVLAIAFYPMNNKDQLIDDDNDTRFLNQIRYDALSNYSGVGSIYKHMHQIVRRQLNVGLNFIKLASQYHGTGQPSVEHSLVDFYEYDEPVPMYHRLNELGRSFVDDRQILERINICDYVQNRGVKQVWIFKANTLSTAGNWQEFRIVPPVASDRDGQYAPSCGKTYTVIIHDFPRWDLLLHVWGHSLEQMMAAADSQLWASFQGPCKGTTEKNCYPLSLQPPVPGRCGTVHIAPNGRGTYGLNGYDITNESPNLSDCESWNPDATSSDFKEISCKNWGCKGPGTIEDNETVNYTIWNLRNMPGKSNDVTYRNFKLRNWWDVYTDYDEVMKSQDRLVVGDYTSPKDGASCEWEEQESEVKPYFWSKCKRVIREDGTVVSSKLTEDSCCEDNDLTFTKWDDKPANTNLCWRISRKSKAHIQVVNGAYCPTN